MQQLLVVGAIIILGTLVLTFNRSTQNMNSNNYFNTAIVDATAAAQSVIEEIETKAFDELTVSSSTSTTTSLTSAGTLGAESGESNRTLFDDIDDYNNFSGVDTLEHFGSFAYKVSVHYVSTASPETNSSAQTFLKKIDVDVFNPYLEDTLSLSRIISY
ncbi:MAG: hypothetical protein HYV28_08970 [Ignavibacteriales bacterium]|nr:hypothetical protein [Ignavibacteriales bacterium]